MFDIVTCGELLAEFVAESTGQPFDRTGTYQGPFPSGAPAIFASQAALMGARVAYAGRVGRDGFGDIIVNRLRTNGVDIEAVERDIEYPTGTAFVSYQADGDRSFVFNIAHSAAGRFELDAQHAERLSECRYFHVMGSSLTTDKAIEILLGMVRRVKEKGGKVSFDPNIRAELMALDATREAILTLVKLCDIFLPSEADIAWLSQGTNETERDTIARLIQHNAMELLVMKRAAKGCQAYTDDSDILVESREVAEVDPTGAGDCFGGALIAALACGETLADALALANAAGAHAVMHLGPMEGCAPRDVLEAMIETNKGAL